MYLLKCNKKEALLRYIMVKKSRAAGARNGDGYGKERNCGI